MKTRELLAIINFSRACEFVAVIQEQAGKVCDRAFQFNSDRRQHAQETAQRLPPDCEFWQGVLDLETVRSQDNKQTGIPKW